MEIFSFIGNMQTLQIVVLTVGLALLLIEVFIPDFGIIGILGIATYIIGILLTAKTFFEGLIMFTILLIFLAIVILLVLNSAKKGRLSKTLILNNQNSSEQGFTAVEDMKVFLNREGKAISVLRPAGIGIFDGIRLDVVTSGTFIEKNEKIKVIEVKGRRIIVEKMEEEK